MNLAQSIDTIMTSDLIVASPDETLNDAKEKFESNNIHHLPVIEGDELQGILSILDLRFFQRMRYSEFDRFVEKTRLNAFKVKELMTKMEDLVTLQSNATIEDALNIFSRNQFHSIPILEGTKLVGLVTTQDIILLALKDKIKFCILLIFSEWECEFVFLFGMLSNK